MDKKMLIVGNWKMHLTVHQSSLLVHRLQERIAEHRYVEVVLAPSLLALQPISLEIDRRRFRLAAQDAYYLDEGPCTGEVSFAMLGELVHYVIVGHSWRRLNAGDTLSIVRDKVKAAIRNDLSPIICIGETKQERDNGEARQVIHDQLTTALMDLTSKDIENVVLAYEPVWAISTAEGIIAKPDDIEKMIRFIREQVRDLYGERAATSMRVLYGGSVDEHDVRSYIQSPDVDGVLVGAASLNYEQFSQIVNVAHQVQTERR